MNRSTFAICVLALMNVTFVVPASAGEMTWGELKAKNVTPLTKEELEALLPGTTYEMFEGKYHVYWKNETDGRLAGAIKLANEMGSGSRRSGTWSVSKDGAYCVDAKGQTDDQTTKWCRHVWKVDGKYFGINRNVRNEAVRVIGFTLKK